jgi:hypothetical protein
MPSVEVDVVGAEPSQRSSTAMWTLAGVLSRFQGAWPSGATGPNLGQHHLIPAAIERSSTGSSLT